VARMCELSDECSGFIVEGAVFSVCCGSCLARLVKKRMEFVL
jgi:hypothetical protein